jgi:hypothetical protein
VSLFFYVSYYDNYIVCGFPASDTVLSERLSNMGTLLTPSLDSNIQALDLSAVIQRLQRKLEWNVPRAEQAVDEYRQFLQLILDGSTPHSPLSDDMDEVWHAHILFTRMYADDCQRIFGRFIHHNPSSDPNGMCCDDGDCQPSS